MIDIDKLFGLLGQFPEHEEVVIPGYGTAKVKVLTQGERDRFDLSLEADKVGFRAKLIQLTVIDERGALVFGEADILKLVDLPVYVLEPIVDVALRINRFSRKDKEELAKNLNGQPVNS